MRTRKSKRLFVILVIVNVLLFVVFGIFWFWPYSIDSYSGDGQITDSGFWSYPRYDITFPHIPLRDTKTYTFVSTGLPPVPLTLQLRVMGKADLDTLKRSNTWIEFRFIEVDGSPAGITICHGGGFLKDWILTYSPVGLKDSKYWHPDFRNIKVKRREEYVVYLYVKNMDPKISRISLEPFLTGGGNESL